MSIDLLVQALLNGFGLAMVYVLVALGLTLIFSILEIINFAHGEFYMLGGYVTYYAYALFGLNYFATLGLAILTVGLAGVVAERLIFHDLRGKALNAFIVSLGLLWVMQAGAQLAFGVLDKPVPSAFSGIVRVLGLVISVERLVVTLSAIVLIVALYLFLRLSRPGRAMRAVAQDADAAALQGVNIEAVAALGALEIGVHRHLVVVRRPASELSLVVEVAHDRRAGGITLLGRLLRPVRHALRTDRRARGAVHVGQRHHGRHIAGHGGLP